MATFPPSLQATDPKTSQSVARFPLWVSIVVVLGALLSITGAVISKVNPLLLTSGGSLTEAAHAYTDYMFARSLVLAIMLLFLLAVRAYPLLRSSSLLSASCLIRWLMFSTKTVTSSCACFLWRVCRAFPISNAKDSSPIFYS